MRLIVAFILVVSAYPMMVFAAPAGKVQVDEAQQAVEWKSGGDVEAFWMEYANSRGGLTWGSSGTYPQYEKVKEGDTFLVQLKQGPCLMEFFHSRWRRANDVRRWDDQMNRYGGCPFVFE